MLGEDCQTHVWSDEDPAFASILPTIEGIFLAGHNLRVDGSLMDRPPNLKVVSNAGVGVDHIDLDAARQRGIPVGNTAGTLDGAVADMTFALLLAAARNLLPGANYARGPAFTHYDAFLSIGTDVHSTTLGIIGMGNIGRVVAPRAKGFDMAVLYHNRKPDPQAEAELGVTYASLPGLLRRSDSVALHVPLNEGTRGMIGREAFAQMKPTAFFVNMAWGAVVDQEALLEALREGRIAGASLDVTEPEPLPRDHPLLQMDNVVIAPHLGSATSQTRQDMLQLGVDNLKAGLAGRPLPRQVG